MAITNIEATYRVTTPMFCGGADGVGAELRLPSFKGALRFWWRALAWSRLGGDLEKIKEEEDRLFGSADGGQSRVLMKLETNTRLPSSIRDGEILTVAQNNRQVVGEGARYLGYGVMHAFNSRSGYKAGQLTRACLPAPFEFTVKMRCRCVKETELESLCNALIALGLLGGMGAKSRKGYGSLALQSLRVNGAEKWNAPDSVNELKDEIARLRNYSSQPSERLPDYTALTPESRIMLANASLNQSLGLLDLVGRELVRYRSWGRNGKILNGRVPSERNFKDDHDLMKQSNSDRRSHPRRIAFGLPHNYGRFADQQVGPYNRDNDRRASPLFIHIHECGTVPIAILSLFPTRFLPEGKSDISVGGQKVNQQPEIELYKPVHSFLDRVLNPRSRKEAFTEAVEVRM